MPLPDISIIIVCYNSGILLKECIESIISSVSVSYEIVIVDNYSPDDTLSLIDPLAEKFSQIKIIKNQTNLGFARANNVGAGNACGRYFHFLNPDTQLNEKINEDYIYILNDSNDRVYVNPIVDMKGNISKSKQKIPFIKNYFNSVFNTEKTIYWFTGASLIISKRLFDKINGWPEDYFMYSEDLDFFYICDRAGIRPYETRFPIIHVGKGSTSTVWSVYEREKRTQRSLKLFYSKYNRLTDYYIIVLLRLFYTLFINPNSFLLQLKVITNIMFTKR